MSDANRIADLALLRVAKIFNVPADSLSRESVFGEGVLKARLSPGLFRMTEYDQIDDDILDVSDRKTYRAITSGKLKIRMVGEYCDHMVRCYEMKPEDVIRVLEGDKR